MRIFYSVLKIIAVTVIALTVTLFSGSLLMQDTVAGIILRSLNKSISTRFEFEKVKLSFLRQFPNASLYLKNVLVHSSPSFDASGFGNISTDTLMSAEAVTVEFSLTDIVKGVYDIDRISIKNGLVNLLSDKNGAVNYEITAEQDNDTASGAFILNLEKINISGIKAEYVNLATQLHVAGYIDNGQLKSRIAGDDIRFSAEGTMKIGLFSLYNFSINRSIPASVDFNLFSSSAGIQFSRSTLTLNNYLFSISGIVGENDDLDLELTGKNIDISVIKDFLPLRVKEIIAAYDPSGILEVKSSIRGIASRTENPLIEALFNVRNGTVKYGNSPLSIQGLSFSGRFTNGPEMKPATSSLAIEEFSGTLGSSLYRGSLLLSDFDSLYGSLKISGKVIPGEIKEFFNIRKISSSSGNIDLSLSLEGPVPLKEKYTLSDIFSLDPHAGLQFNSFTLGTDNEQFKISNARGQISVSDTVIVNNLSFSFRDHDFTINGSFLDLPGWLENSASLSGSAVIRCGSLEPEKLFSAHTGTKPVQKKAFSMPGDVALDVQLTTGRFRYKTLEAENISASISYKPGVLNFKSMNIRSLDGYVSGNGFFVQNRDKSFLGRGNFNIEGIDITKTFTSFKNFGQDFIKAENIAGTLFGSVSVMIPMDSMLNPVIKSITAEGKYVIEKGALIDFGPVKDLSSFIELSELENIRFEKLENDFFIRNNYLYTPLMDVKSSAADLSVNGKHSFDNAFEYHVKILLSEALSKKIRKPKPNTTEFGAVQDDGLGKTSLLLKIESKGDDVKVGYDVKAAGTKVKSEIKSERQNLKTILNEEYGWYRNDSTVKTSKPAEPKKFRISWEETDTVKAEDETGKQETPPGIKSLFRKRDE